MAQAKLLPLTPNLSLMRRAHYYLPVKVSERRQFFTIYVVDATKIARVCLSKWSSREESNFQYAIISRRLYRLTTGGWSPREDSNLHVIQLTFLLVRSERVYWGVEEALGFEPREPFTVRRISSAVL